VLVPALRTSSTVLVRLFGIGVLLFDDPSYRRAARSVKRKIMNWLMSEQLDEVRLKMPKAADTLWAFIAEMGLQVQGATLAKLETDEVRLVVGPTEQ
jgi:hypothetical protein